MAEAMPKEQLDNFFEDWVPELEYNVLTSQAVPEPEYVPEERPEVRPQRPVRPGRERKVRIHKVPETKPKTRRVDRSKIFFLLSAAILLIGCLGVVSGYSDVYSRKAQIDDLKEEIEDAKKSAGTQMTMAASSQDMSEIYSYAINELGMEEADNSDIVMIRLPEKSYTYVTTKPAEQGSRVTIHWFSKK